MNDRTRQILLLSVTTIVTLVGARFLSEATDNLALMVVAGLVLGFIAFLKTEFAILLLIVSMLLSPELSIGKTTGATLGRGITLRLDDLLILVVSAAWFLKSAIHKDLNLLNSTPVNRPAFVYIGACLVATLLGIQAGRIAPLTGLLFVFKYIQYIVIFWMVVNHLKNKEQAHRYVLALFGVAILIACVAIIQIPSGQRVSAPFEGERGEPNTLGGYLVLMIALALGIAVNSRSHRIPAYGTLAVLFIPFLYTLSRASYLAFIPMVFVVLWVSRQRGYLTLLTACLFVVLLAPAVLPSAVQERIAYTFNQPWHRDQKEVMGVRVDTSTSARLQSFEAAMEAFREKPIWGWGVTGWRFIDSQYFRTLVETGIVGFVAFVYLMGVLFRTSWSCLKRVMDSGDTFYRGLSCGFLGGFVGLLVHGIGANTFIIIRIMEPFWLVCAMIVTLPDLLQAEEKELTLLSAELAPKIRYCGL